MSGSTFIKLDEGLFHDKKIRDLIRKGGYHDFGLYIGLLTVMRSYEAQAYRVPYEALDEIAAWDLATTKEELEGAIQNCIEVGLFNSSPDEFWSPRRVKDLMSQQELREKCKQSAARTNAMRKRRDECKNNQEAFSELVARIQNKAKA